VAASDEFVYRRVHEATCELLFECLTQPAHLGQFWGPAGMHTPAGRIVVDLRPGGAFETVMVDDATGAEHRMRAVYVEVDPPIRLVWREVESGMITTITLDDLGDGRTEVTTRQQRVPAAYQAPAARAGWATSLERFASYVAAVSATPRACWVAQQAKPTGSTAQQDNSR
jgi:uncharacterized protein YndB with AHSA1/START domain